MSDSSIIFLMIILVLCTHLIKHISNCMSKIISACSMASGNILLRAAWRAVTYRCVQHGER